MKIGWLLGALACASVASAQAPDSLPFGSGERLTFRVRTAKLGTVGHAVMAVSGPVDVRGTETIVASFETSVRMFFMKGGDSSRSWIDPLRMTSLRFEKHERRPFSSDDDSVNIYPDAHRWAGLHGDSGTTGTAAPLDELAFLYFLRTVTLAPDSLYSFDRHYDARRLPTTVRVVKHETLQATGGLFNTVELEMRVNAGRPDRGESVLHIWLSEDRCRLPVRIESTVRVLGNGIMTLESAVTPTCHVNATLARGPVSKRD